ncbi:sulfotransferase domain-containing protein [Sneathiella sp. P13V-1]|uniref:sulfotransferase domain-containing protein n=1 Tax=Sneathiella sp. P13V-1 TaxID=2697366 RepID=UPI00187B5680|nr:sulfotransferase domain-containing protein [Sneathiella sp. P13V-1]MBE7636093.1 sulfotransferase domain-containing protein [Sneathiella sp. P13V-1]
MGGIIWLASYPKSGNTWMRSFLQNVILGGQNTVHINELSQFAYGDGQKIWYEQAAGGSIDGLSAEQKMKLTPRAHMAMTRSRPQSVFVKTHNWMGLTYDTHLITMEATAGAIHIIRNPLDVSISLAHHFGFSIDESIEFMSDPEAQTAEDDYKMPQYYGSWSDHTKSWDRLNPQYMHRVRYEDMLTKPGKTFSEVLKFLQIKVPKSTLAKAIKQSSFKTLQSQEKKDGFLERSDKAESFFRSGKAGEWKSVLTDEQVKKIVDTHHDVMEKYGYLKGL